MAKLSRTREELANAYIEALKEDKLIWRKGWRGSEGHFNYKTHQKYKGINQLMLNLTSATRGYKDPRWLTFSQIKNEGFQLEDAKGKGVHIEKWSMYDRQNKKYLNYSDYANIVRNEQLDSEEVKDRFCWSVKTYTVFNAEHVKGIEPYESVENNIDLNEIGEKFIDNYCTNSNLSIEYGNGNHEAYYSPTVDAIYLPDKNDFISNEELYATTFHEMAHSTMNEGRLNRPDAINTFGSKDYALEELRAEISSSFICADLGLDQSEEIVENHKAYIQSWISTLENNPEKLFEAIKDAEKISDYVEVNGELEKLLINDKSITMNMNNIIKYFAVEHEGKFDDIYAALKAKEPVSNNQIQMLNGVHCKMTCLLDNDYPDEFKQMPNPPFVLFHNEDISKDTTDFNILLSNDGTRLYSHIDDQGKAHHYFESLSEYLKIENYLNDDLQLLNSKSVEDIQDLDEEKLHMNENENILLKFTDKLDEEVDVSIINRNNNKIISSRNYNNDETMTLNEAIDITECLDCKQGCDFYTTSSGDLVVSSIGQVYDEHSLNRVDLLISFKDENENFTEILKENLQGIEDMIDNGISI